MLKSNIAPDPNLEAYWTKLGSVSHTVNLKVLRYLLGTFFIPSGKTL